MRQTQFSVKYGMPAGPARAPGGARPGAARALRASAAGAQVVVVDQGCDPGLREAAELASEALTRCCDEGLVACIRARAAPAESTCSRGALSAKGRRICLFVARSNLQEHMSVAGCRSTAHAAPPSAWRMRGGPPRGKLAAGSGQPAALAKQPPCRKRRSRCVLSFGAALAAGPRVASCAGAGAGFC